MRHTRLSCLLAMLSFFPFAGCSRRPVVAVAPPPPPPVMVSVPPPTHPTEPEPDIPLAEVPPLTLPVPRVPRPPRYRPAPVQPPSEIASATPPPIDLGNLTTGGESTDNTLRQQTGDLLTAQHKRLDAVPRATIALHSSQIAQARQFLRQADDAWKKLDIEGARTLATKAKLILDEVLG